MLICVAVATIAAADVGFAASRVAVAWHDATTGSGRLQALSTEAPWNYASAPLEVAANPIVRFAEERLFVVSPTDDRLQIVDPGGWTLEQT